MKNLLKSRKFLLLILDTLISMAVYFIGKYFPVGIEDAKILIFGLQPVFVAIICAIAYEDSAYMNSIANRQPRER